MTTDDQGPAEPAAARIQYVSATVARSEWASAAFEVLLQTAHHYEAVVTHTQLAEAVQERTGLHTRTESRHWIGQVLADVMRKCADQNLPPLTALAVVRADSGARGAGPETDAAEILAKREQRSVSARLRCYRRFAPDIPDSVVHALAVAEREEAAEEAARVRSGRGGSGRSASGPRGVRAGTRSAAARASQSWTAPRAAKRTERETAVCPTCFTALPATGICDTCDA